MNELTEYDDDIEVELAGGWERIGAVVLNNIFNTLLSIPFIVHFLTVVISLDELRAKEVESSEILFRLAIPFLWLLLPLAFQIYQLVLLSQHGQTLGKKLLNIKIIRQNGEPAGFVHAFLLREAVYQFGINFIFGIAYALALPIFLASMQGNPENMTALNGVSMLLNLLSALPPLICVIMLFAQRERRTLQDLIAGTIVVKLPRR